MRNLFLLLIKNGGLLLFLLLEGLCMFLVVQFNKNQNEIYFSSTAAFTGAIYNQFDEIIKYWNLSSVADNLARENAQLYSQLDSLKNTFASSLQSDTIDRNDQPHYTFIPARVVNNSISGRNNSMIINVGKSNGVMPGMGVIGNNGIVGIVRAVTNQYAIVMSILHSESRISGAIRRNGHFGFVVWPGIDPMEAHLIDVPKHVQLKVNDTIQTSGYSTIFPEAIQIGVIKDFRLMDGSNSYSIDVRLSNDLSNIKYVYVVNYIFKEEVQQLQEEVADE